MPFDIQGRFQRALTLHQAGRVRDAHAIYQEILSADPRHFDSLHLSGLAALQTGHHQASVERLDQALQVNATFAPAHYHRGLALNALGRPAEALPSYTTALALKPDYIEAHIARGNALMAVANFREARSSYEAAVALKPDDAEAHYRLGNALRSLNLLEDATICYGRAVAKHPGHVDAHNNLGNTLTDLHRPDQAVASYDRALSLRPEFVEALNNRGNALKQLGRLDEALASYDKALALRPDYVEAHSNRGSVFSMLQRFDEALANYDKALSLRPDYPAAHFNRANALKELYRAEEAVAAYDAVAAHFQGFAGFHVNRGNALRDLKRLDEALASYEKALQLNPNYDLLRGTYLNIKMMLCDWRSFERDLDGYAAAVLAGKRVTNPFVALSLVDSPELHRIAAQTYSDSVYPAARTPAPKERREGGKIRVGYYSGDLHNHATGYLTAELFEKHDREKFEIYAFSFGPNVDDTMRRRLRPAFHKFVDIANTGDAAVAQLSRQAGIDIAVDLKGHTNGSRPGLFAQRCAPIQVSFLGYPGTMGASYVDYVIADRVVIPEASQGDFTEKVVYLPHSYQVNDSTRAIADEAPARKTLGLPKSGFVFCCFNNAYKILPATFDSWMRILRAVEGSVLWLLQSHATATANLRREAEARGVDGARLVLAGMVELREHLARCQQADLFLDTVPYNAHTTASDALWAGVPVLTLAGKSFASRVAASLLEAIQLPELIVRTGEDYETTAIELATNPARLGALRSKLGRNRATSPLFDGGLFARHLEAAFEAMQARARAGLPPAVIEVPRG